MAGRWTTQLAGLLLLLGCFLQLVVARIPAKIAETDLSLSEDLGDRPAEMSSGVVVVPNKGGEASSPSSSSSSSSGSGGTEVHVPQAALPIALIMVCSIIVQIYSPSGPTVVASVLVYVLALATMKLAVKWVFLTHNFPFAKFVTALHFLSGMLVTSLIYHRRGLPLPRPSLKEFSLMMCPIALAFSCSIAANNMALLFSTAAFTEIVGATNCLITIVMVVLMGLPFYKWLAVPASVVAFGCALGTAGELHFSLLGFVLCLSSNVFRSLKVVLQQQLLTGATKDRFDPIALLFWVSLPSFLVTMSASLMTEGAQPYSTMAKLGSEDASALHGLVFSIILSCCNAVILNLAQLYVTKDLGAVGGQLVAQAKMILTVLGGMILFHEAFSKLEVAGFLLALVGVYTFTRMDQAYKASLVKAKEDPAEAKAKV